MKKNIFAITFLCLGWAALPLSAEVMTYQGRLKESNVPVNANRTFLFEFCATETPTGCVASADGAKPFAVQNGLFKSTFTLPAVDLSAGPWYLRVQVEGSYLSPVERLTFVPYSLYASTAGYSPAALQKAGDTMTGQLTLSGSSLTLTGSEFSVGGSTLVVKGGNVGIGTTVPLSLLHINSPSDVPRIILSNNLGGAGRKNWAIQTDAIANGDFTIRHGDQGTVPSIDAVYITNTGSVGIGTTSPAYRLVVSSGAGETGMIMAVSTGSTNVFWVDGSGVNALKFTGDGSGLTGVTGAVGTDSTRVLKAGDTMSGQLTNTSSVTITGNGGVYGLEVSSNMSLAGVLYSADGKVGIGTAGPGFKLDVVNTDGNAGMFRSSGVNDAWLYLRSDSTKQSGLVLGDTTPANLWFLQTETNDRFSIAYSAISGQKLTIDTAGNVGIGTTNPGAMLDVAGSGNFSGSITSLSSGTFRAVGGSQFSVETSSGILVQAGRIQAPAIQLTNGAAANYVLASDAAGNASWVNPAAGGVGDGWVGNEITDAADASLTRSGAGIAVDPYKIGLNLANPNTWTAGQTFNAGLAGGLTGAASLNVLKSGDTMTGGLTLAGSTLTVTGDAFSVGGSTLVVKNGYLGLGTDAPASRLHVVSDNGYVTFASPNTPLTMNMVPQTYAPAILNNNGDGPIGFTIANDVKMWIDRQTLVGIGTQTPSYRLHVSSGAGETGTILAVSTGATNIFTVDGSGVNAIRFTGDGSGLTGVTGASGTDSTKVLKAGDTMTGQLTNTSSITITGNGGIYGLQVSSNVSLAGALYSANGNVGIGTTTPGGKLHIYSPGQSRLFIDSPDNAAQLVLNSGATGNFVGMTIQTGNTSRWHVGENVGTVEIPNFTIYDQAAATSRFYINSTGNVGIGTTTPSYRLHVSSGAGEAGIIMAVSTGTSVVFGVKGNGEVSGGKFIGDGSGLTNLPVPGGLVSIAGDTMIGQLTNTSSITITGNGGGAYGLGVSSNVSLAGALYSANSNVGIGTTSPGYKLDVLTSAPFPARFLSGDNYSTLILGHTGIGARNWGLVTGVGSSTGKFGIQDRTSNVVSFVIDTVGNVGIGTTGPSYLLHVSSGAGEAGTIMAVSTGATNLFWVAGDGAHATKYYGDGSGITGVSATDATKLPLAGGTMSGQLTNTSSVTITGNGGAYGLQVSSNVSLAGALYSANGKVGIGTTGPVSRLDIKPLADNGASGLHVRSFNSDSKYISLWRGDNGGVIDVAGPAATPPPYLGITFDGTEKVRIDSSGNVGIGTTGPGNKLAISGSGATWTNGTDIGLYNTTNTNSAYAGLRFYQAVDAGVEETAQIRTTLQNGSQANFNDRLEFLTATQNDVNYTLMPRMVIDNLGNVGIGTTAPEQRLTVAGNISQTGVLISSGTGRNYFAGEVTAARYQIGGSTVLAVLPGTGSLGVGPNAGRVNTADGNLFVGVNAGYSSDGGINNSFIGTEAGYNNTTGLGNLFIGYYAGRANSFGGNNSFAGSQSGLNNTGDNNSFFGADSGLNNNAGNSNVFIGARAGYNSNGTGNIVIGYNKDTSVQAADYELNIGGLLYGDLTFKTIGISTRVPQAALDIVSTGTVQTQFAQIWRDGSGVIKSSMSATGVLMAGKFVGDGSGITGVSATDATKLPIAGGFMSGQLTNTSSVTITGNGGAYGLEVSSNISLAGALYSANGNIGIGRMSPMAVLDILGPVNFGDQTATGLKGNIRVQAADGAYPGVYNNAIMLGYFASETANNGATIGLGRLRGSYTAPAIVQNGDILGILNIQGWYGPGWASAADIYAMADGVWSAASTPTKLVFTVASSGSTTANNHAVMLIDNQGNVGISTSAPQARLDVLAGGSAQTDMAQLWRNSAGTIISSVSATGVMMASKFIGDGSGLANVSATDNSKLPLGGGTLTGQLTLAGSSLTVTGDITGARYQIKGSTVVAILPGSESLGIGVNAGRVNTGNYNVFVGSAAGYSNTTASNNSFLGYMTGYSNTTGTDNSFVGSAAGYSNVSGTSNSIFGSFAGYFNTTGMENSFMGYNAGRFNTTGAYNSFVGAYAGYANTTGGNNSSVGYYAGFQNKAGSANAIVGNQAGFGVVNNSFSSSTLMGYKAGFGLTTGSDNILLGFQAGYNVTTGTGNIVIGYNKDTTAPGANNQLNIGGVLYGDLSARTIGISTRVPQAALDIVSTGSAVNQYAQIWRDSTGLVVASMTATGRLSGDGSGLTGVSATDATKLPIAGGTMSGQLTNTSSVTITGNGGGAYGLEVSSNVTLAGILYSANGNIGVGSAAPGAKLDIYSFNTTSFLEVHNASIGGKKSFRVFQSNNHGLLDVFDTAETIAIRLNAENTSPSYINAGKVGIGTTLPDQNLTVAGNISQTGVLISSGAGNNYFAGNVGIAAPNPIGVFQVGGGSLTVLAGGNVGIGTTAPQSHLQVDDALNATAAGAANLALLVRHNTITAGGGPGIGFSSDNTPGVGAKIVHIRTGSNSQGDLAFYTKTTNAVPESEKMRIKDSGNVGISTGVPEARLDVLAGGSTQTDMAQIWRNSAGTIVSSVSATGVLMANKFVGDGSGLNSVSASDPTKLPLSGGTLTGQLTVSASSLTVRSNAALSPLLISTSPTPSVAGLYVDGSNNVGIGTTLPAYKLDIVGQILRITDPGNATIYLNSAGTTFNITSAGGVWFLRDQTNDPGGTRIAVTAAGLVGMGSASPGSKLGVSGNLGIGAGYVTTAAPLNGAIIEGRVGIGTTAPSRKLEVNGEITASRYEIGGSTVVAILPGIESLGVGINAGRVNTGDYNVFVGLAAGYNNTIGIHNSFLGASAGNSNTTGEGNSFVGYKAGYSNTSGGNNSFMGASAGYSNTTGWDNSTAGLLAGYYNKVGSANAIFGNEAGFGVSNNSFSSSTLMGYRAGYNLQNGSADNIFVGFQAGNNVTTGTGNIVIGYDKDTSAPGASNELNIGGVIYGNLSAGYVGVGAGVTNPGGALQVGQNGLIISTGGAIQTTGLGHGSTAGSARGVGAVDLQTFRTAASQVASGLYAVVSGGYGNTSSNYSFVGGGYTNLASGGYSVAGGGQSNLSSNGWTTVAGGSNNIASQNNATVGGGSGNIAAGYSATVAGGSGNNVQSTAFAGFIGGGGNNISTGAYSTVGGGQLNTSSGAYSAVLGGYRNVAQGPNSGVAGGSSNLAYGANSAVTGGKLNSAWGDFSTVSGGNNNSAAGLYSIIAGGDFNSAGGQGSAVVGGNLNNASGTSAFIGGGGSNEAKGWGAVVFGGNSAAMGGFSFAAGYRSTSAVDGTFTWSDSQGIDVVNNVPDQVMFKAKGGFWVSTGTVYADPGLYVSVGNRVGIGTAVPTAKLHVGGTPGVDGIRFPDGSLQTTAGLGSASDVTNPTDAIINGDSDGNQSGSVKLKTAGLDRVHVSTGGQVGIGTTNPSVMFHNAGSAILASNYTTIDPDSYGSAVIAGALSDAGWTVSAGIGGMVTNAGTTWGIGHNNVDLLFAAGDATNPNTLQTFMQATWKRNLALVPVSGGVGIGTAAIPDQKLTVIGNISQTGVLISSGAGNSYFAGNIGIGTNTPVAMLDVNGTARLARHVVESRDSGGTMSADDFGKTITVNSASPQAIALPVGTAGSVGAQFTFVKLGTGKLTLNAGATDFIADSSMAGNIYNDAVSPAFATITLRLVTSNKWMLVGGEGAWVTQ